MPRTKIKPNAQLKAIVLEETNDGRDVVRYLKSVFMEVEDAPRLFGLSPKEYARTHKIAAARILARIGLEEGKRYLRRNYVQTPFKRVHPEDEDGPKREMAASTSELYRLVKKETNDGRDIIIRFVGIMKGYHPEYKPHLRMAAAKELIRQIEFDYEDEPTPSGSDAAPEPTASQANPVHTEYPVNPDSDDSAATVDPTDNYELTIDNSDDAPTDHPHPENPDHPVNPDSDTGPLTDRPRPVNPVNPINHSSDPSPIDNSKLEIENSESDAALQAYREYIRRNCAPEAESIYQSIIRRASDRPDLDSARHEAEKLIEDFNRFIAERAPGSSPVNVPGDILFRSLTGRIENSELLFDPADYYHLDQDNFYFCQCRDCEDCDELDFFIETWRELEEETDYLLEDP